VAFGREEKVGTKRKQGSSQMTWVYPFRYDNIENHVLTQHPEKWDEYKNERKTWRYGLRYDECNKFFAKNITMTASRNYFRSPEQPGQARSQLVFTIDKDIVESIIGDMMYSCGADEEEEVNGNHDDEEVHADNSNNGDGEEDGSVSVVLDSSRFCTAAEQAAVVADRRVVAARAKALALSLLRRLTMPRLLLMTVEAILTTTSLRHASTLQQ
jgi:hypothetical protein